MSHTAVIIEVPGTDPATDRFVVRRSDHTTTVVLTADADGVPALAAALVDAGADAVELCGGFGVVPQAAVEDAVDGRARVGAILYGFESLEQIAAYKAGFAAGEDLPGGFLVLHPGADPAVDRTVHDGEVKATIVAVPNNEAAGPVARELAGQGARLFELYGGLGAQGARAVLDATDGAIPVGITSDASARPKSVG